MEGGLAFFVYKPAAFLREIIWVGGIAVCSVFRNPSLSNAGYRSCFSFSYIYFS